MPLLSRQDLDFCLYEMLDTDSLLHTPRYGDHSRETFNQTLNTAEQVAEKYFAPHNHLADEKEPWFDGEQVHTIPEVKEAFRHYVNSGLLTARLEFDAGGMHGQGREGAMEGRASGAGSRGRTLLPMLLL